MLNMPLTVQKNLEDRSYVEELAKAKEIERHRVAEKKRRRVEGDMSISDESLGATNDTEKRALVSAGEGADVNYKLHTLREIVRLSKKRERATMRLSSKQSKLAAVYKGKGPDRFKKRKS